MQYCYSCSKIRPAVATLPCFLERCEKCTKKHIERCDTCSRVLYVDSKGEIQEFKMPTEEPTIPQVETIEEAIALQPSLAVSPAVAAILARKALLANSPT